MGDHFVLLVDRLLTESTLAAAIQSGSILKQAAIPTIKDASETCFSSGKMVECRICQDEDLDSAMESPCSCSGSLKYAHRICVQKWCNEKGDTTCEICHQQFKPGYFAPPSLFRRNWQIARRNLDNHRIYAMVSTDPSFIDPYDDDYPASTSPRSLALCRAVATIFMAFLILGHTLLVADGAGTFTFPLCMMMMLGVSGIIISVFVILRTVCSDLLQRHQTNPSAEEEEDGSGLNPQELHVIAIQ